MSLRKDGSRHWRFFSMGDDFICHARSYQTPRTNPNDEWTVPFGSLIDETQQVSGYRSFWIGHLLKHGERLNPSAVSLLFFGFAAGLAEADLYSGALLGHIPEEERRAFKGSRLKQGSETNIWEGSFTGSRPWLDLSAWQRIAACSWVGVKLRHEVDGCVPQGNL